MVDADSGVVIYISRFCKADDWMNKYIRLAGSCGADGKFAMGAVHRVARLKCYYTCPVELFKELSELRGSNYYQSHVLKESTSVFDVIVMIGAADGLQFAADVVLFSFVMEIMDRGVKIVV